MGRTLARAGLLLALPVLLALASAGAVLAQQPGLLITAAGVHIASATTTTLTAATTGVIELWSMSACVPAGGTQTAITIRDSAGTNLAGTSVTWTIAPGTCFVAPLRGRRYFDATGTARSLQLVTSDIGPVDVVWEVVK